MGRSIGKKSERRPLEGGTLLPDFLGRGNLLSRTHRLERQAREVSTSMLSLTAAESGYTRRRGALFMTGWAQSGVSAGQTNVTLNRFGVAAQAPLILPFAASVLSLMVVLTGARTSGTLTVKVYIAGADSGLAALIDTTGMLYVEETAAAGAFSFEAGEQVTLRLTTSAGWAPGTADMMVMVEVAAIQG